MTAIFLILLGACFLMLLERLIPDQKLPQVKGWWSRVVLINIIQGGLVITGGYTWDLWFKQYSFFNISSFFSSAFISALTVYIFLTFIYYWWHRWRHTINFLWLTCHQLHHSPARIETVTSFYKHPLEIFLNSILISFIAYVVFGLDPYSGSILTIITAYAEFFYHMNIKTPHWIGYIIQRPEMHRIHHQRGVHYSNFADLPVWDILFKTYKNPRTYKGLCGFKVKSESKILDMLLFKNVNNPFPKDNTQIKSEINSKKN